MGSPSTHHCAGCNGKILDQWVLFALDKSWHENCLRCSCCHVKLDDIQHKLFYREGLMLCRNDYLRLYSNCCGCNEKISSGMMVMRARDSIYHTNCFKCSVCSVKLNSGDRFFYENRKLLCEYDFHELRVFQMAAVSNAHLEEISKNLQELDEFELEENRHQ